jgi:tRNA A37 methylthiotransferase MiaB
VTHFNPEDQTEARELDANLLEEMCNTTLSNVRKYQAALNKYYNKSVVQREINIGDLVPKKDIRTKDKHKFSTPWEEPFIIVDDTAPGAYVLVEVDGGMLSNT